jgi:hypothetical protein
MSDLLTVSEVAETLQMDMRAALEWVKLRSPVIFPGRNEYEIYRVKRETVETFSREQAEKRT